MTFETFQHTCIAATGMLEAERETLLDFINMNGVEFSVETTNVKGIFGFGVMMSYGTDTHIEYFLKTANLETAIVKNIIDAAIAMADWIEKERDIDQYDLQELTNRDHENN
jgi:hypothetical protein